MRPVIGSVLAAVAVAAPAASILPSAAAAQAQEHSARFAAEAMRICIDTRAAAASVRGLAAAEGWTATDATALPAEHSITLGGRPNTTHYPSNIWTLETHGLPLTVLVYDIAEDPSVRHCEVLAWDLDSEAVDGALKSDPRVRGGFFESPRIPMRRYEVRSPRQIFRYGAAEKGTRTLHVLAAS